MWQFARESTSTNYTVLSVQLVNNTKRNLVANKKCGAQLSLKVDKRDS